VPGLFAAVHNTGIVWVSGSGSCHVCIVGLCNRVCRSVCVSVANSVTAAYASVEKVGVHRLAWVQVTTGVTSAAVGLPAWTICGLWTNAAAKYEWGPL